MKLNIIFYVTVQNLLNDLFACQIPNRVKIRAILTKAKCINEIHLYAENSLQKLATRTGAMGLRPAYESKGD